MKQVFQNPKSGKLRVEEIPAPLIKRGGILVKNSHSVISVGTERSIIELSKGGLLQKAKERPDYVQKFIALLKTKGVMAAWRTAQSKLATDIPLGYASAGEVMEVGEGAEEFSVGDRVACGGQDYASHAEYIYVPKNLCAKIPGDVATEEAGFATLAAIAMQGIRQASLTPGEKVGIIGLGLLGQLAARILRAYGHPVVGCDINEAQVQFAKENGMDEGIVIGRDNYQLMIDKFTEGNGVDAVLIYASAKTNDPLRLAVEIARDRGRIVQVGSIVANIPWRDFYKKELQYLSSRSYGPGRYDPIYEEKGVDYPIGYVRWTEKRNMEEFLRLLGEKRITIKNLITHTFPIERAEEAYKEVLQPKGLTHGIVLEYSKSNHPETTLPVRSHEREKYKKQEKVVIGLIGMGAFMNGTIVPALKKIQGVRIKAICHTKGLPAKNKGLELGAEYVTTDYKKLMNDSEINLIICATRHSAHAMIAKEALVANKNIYIEKPLGINKEEVREVGKVAAHSKGRLLIGFNRRFAPHIQEAKKEFNHSATPKMILYRVNAGPLEKNHWSYEKSEGGRLIGEGCHFIDLMQYIIGHPPVRIWASAVPQGGAVSHEENMTVTIEYKDGSTGVILYSALGNVRMPKEYIEIYADGKVMIIDNFIRAKVIESKKTRTLNKWRQEKGYAEELQAMVESIEKGSPSPMEIHDILISHETTFAIEECIKKRTPIELQSE